MKKKPKPKRYKKQKPLFSLTVRLMGVEQIVDVLAVERGSRFQPILGAVHR